jgi:tetratricopeptide (TPR) repeat protein
LISYVNIGEFLGRNSKPDEARNSLEAARKIAKEHARKGQSETSVEYDRWLWRIDGDIAFVLATQAKVDDAFPYIEEALAITKDRSSTDLSNPEWQMSAWYTDFFISVMQPVPPGRARAVHNAEVESHRIENQLTANASLSHSSPKVLVDLAKMQSSWGDLLRAKSKLNGAITYYKKAYKNRKLLAERDPSDIGWQSDLEVIDDKIGAVLVENNKLDDALDSYRESLKISKGLAEKDPGDIDLQRDLSMSHLNIGVARRSPRRIRLMHNAKPT